MLYAIGLFTAVLTAFYMSRLVFMTFYGDARWGDVARGGGRGRRRRTPSAPDDGGDAAVEAAADADAGRLATTAG